MSENGWLSTRDYKQLPRPIQELFQLHIGDGVPKDTDYSAIGPYRGPLWVWIMLHGVFNNDVFFSSGIKLLKDLTDDQASSLITLMNSEIGWIKVVEDLIHGRLKLS